VRRRGGRLAFGAALVAIYAFLLAPLVVVVAVSFDPTEAFRFPPPGLSLRWYRAFFASEPFVHAFFRVSLVVALLVSVVATMVGALAAVGLVRLRFPGRAAVETAFLAPIVVPEILLGAALFLFYARLRFQAGLAGLVLSHLLVAVPYVIRAVTAGLTGVSPSLEEAAMSLGAGRVQAFCRVTLPLIRSSLLSGAVFAFIISFSDINLALFLAGANAPSLPVHIFSQIQFEADPSIAAASALQIAIVGGLILLVQRVFRLRLMV
jgi:ABC-type spermidine/putrescine transport system permease subunit II